MYNFIITVGVQRQYMRLIRENDTYSLNILNFTMIVRVRMHTTVQAKIFIRSVQSRFLRFYFMCKLPLYESRTGRESCEHYCRPNV